MARLRTPRKAAIQRYCAEKGWGPQELARHAAISITTAYKAFNGDQMFRCKLVRIANSLKKPVGLILDESDPEALVQGQPAVDAQVENEPSADPRQIVITVTIKGDIHTLTDRDIVISCNSMLRTIRESEQIEPDNIRYGSVHITMTIGQVHAARLVTLLAHNGLVGVDVESVSIHDAYQEGVIASYSDIRAGYGALLGQVYDFLYPDGLADDDPRRENLESRLVEMSYSLWPAKKLVLLRAVVTCVDERLLDIDIVTQKEWRLTPSATMLTSSSGEQSSYSDA